MGRQVPQKQERMWTPGVKSNADITCIEKTFHSYPDCVGHDFQAFSRLQENAGHLLCATHSSNIWLNE